MFGHLKAQLAFYRFHLRGKQGAKIDIGLALMALNLRKLGNYMEKKARKKKKTSLILTLIIKIRLVFFFRRTIVPDSIFCSLLFILQYQASIC